MMENSTSELFREIRMTNDDWRRLDRQKGVNIKN